MASTPWLLVGCLLPAAMTMLFLASKVALTAPGADGVGGSFSALVRSDAVFGGRLEAEAATGDRSSTNVAVSCGFFEFETRGGAGTRTAPRIFAFSSPYRSYLHLPLYF